jgi:hypothetical protein
LLGFFAVVVEAVGEGPAVGDEITVAGKVLELKKKGRRAGLALCF